MILVTHLPAAAGGGVGVGTNNPDTKNPYYFNTSFVINDPTDASTDTYELVAVSVVDQFSLTTEPLPQEDGMQSGIPRKVRKLIHMEGIVHASTLGALEYAAMQMHRYLDPVNAFWDDSGSTMAQDKGFMDLVFSVPTTDTTNYPTGLITVEAFVRSVQRPVTSMSKLQGYNARFQIAFEMIDPRFYHSTSQSVYYCGVAWAAALYMPRSRSIPPSPPSP